MVIPSQFTCKAYQLRPFKSLARAEVHEALDRLLARRGSGHPGRLAQRGHAQPAIGGEGTDERGISRNLDRKSVV